MVEQGPRPLSHSDRKERLTLFRGDNAYKMWVRDFFLFKDNKELRVELWRNIRERRQEYLNPSADPNKLLADAEKSYPDFVLSASAA